MVRILQISSFFFTSLSPPKDPNLPFISSTVQISWQLKSFFLPLSIDDSLHLALSRLVHRCEFARFFFILITSQKCTLHSSPLLSFLSPRSFEIRFLFADKGKFPWVDPVKKNDDDDFLSCDESENFRRQRPRLASNSIIVDLLWRKTMKN